jgi:hypothetical protein
MHLRPSLAGAVVALLAMPAAAAIAAPPPPPVFTKALLKCYVSASPTQTQPIEIQAAQFMPMAPVDVFIDNVKVTPPPGTFPPTANAAGVLEGSVSAPFIASGQRFFTLRLAEQARDPAVIPPSVSATSKVAALSVTASPSKPRTTSTRVRCRGRGFTNRLEPIYAHYVFKKRARQTVLIAGKPFGDCGQFSVRRRQFPMKRPHVGTWTVQFDQEQAYNPKALAYTRLKIVVSRKPGRR